LHIRKSSPKLLTVAMRAIALLFLSWSLGASVAAAADAKFAAIVIDANSGKTLYERNADSSRYPASLTKMMTLYILFEELDAGRLKLTSLLSVSATAAAQAPTKLGLKAGSTVEVEDALLGLVTKSANDAAVVVAENISGSIPAFAARMNRTARALGMTNTTFRNPNGLPDPGQHTTARDLARLGLALQDRFPTYYKYFGTRTFTFRGARIRNHNRLLGSVQGVDGIKTGYIRASGFNIVTNVNRDGRHIIAVVMGGKTASRRDAQMRELIADYLPDAKRGARSAPLLVADAESESGTDAPVDATTDAVADSRVPRSRPNSDDERSDVLAYAADEAPHDLVAAALAEARTDNSEGDVGGPDEMGVTAAPPDDPIAMRIQTATSVAAFADITMQTGDGPDPIARLQQVARLRAGIDDIVAGSPVKHAANADAGDPAGWHVQLGATPTQEGAQALLNRAKASMGTDLAALRPVTQEVESNGTTLYRARFAGLSDKDEARTVCQKLKRKSFSCLAVPN
jgi:D-alanyl-D-alanine carboxypeptidase